MARAVSPATVDELAVEPLTAEAFAPFGEVIEVAGTAETINYGRTLKYADRARIDVAADGGRPALHLYRSQPTALPLEVRVLERHPLGTQAFFPLGGLPWLVIVAPPGEAAARDAVRAFRVTGDQGVNLGCGVWHHFQVSLEAPSDYLVIDRAGPGANFEECRIDPPLRISRLSTSDG